MLSYLRIAYTYAALFARREVSARAEAAGDQVPHRANVCHSGLAGSTSLIKKIHPSSGLVVVSSLLAAETQESLPLWDGAMTGGEWWREGMVETCNTAGGRGSASFGGCQSKKVNDSTMLAPPTLLTFPPNCLPGLRKRRLVLEIGVLRGKGGCWSVDFAWGVWTGNIYDYQHPGWHHRASCRFTVSIQHPPPSHP